MSKVNKICGVDAEAIAALLSLEVGELREKLAYCDASTDLDDFLNREFEYDADDYEIDEDEIELYDDDEEDDDEDYWDTPDDDDSYDDDEDYGDDEVDTPSLTNEEQELADAIVDDIDNGRYTLAAIQGVYPTQVVEYVENNID